MTEGENTVNIMIRAELGQLREGLAKAEREVNDSARRMDALARSNATVIGRTLATYGVAGGAGGRPTPYGVASDSSFGQSKAAAEAAADQVRTVTREAERSQKALGEISRISALIGRTMAVASAATYSFRVSSELAAGSFDSISEAIRSAPLGLGQAVGMLEDMLNYTLGIDAALYSESAGQQRRRALEAEQKAAIQGRMALDALEMRVAAESAATDEMRTRLTQEAELLQIRARYQKMLDDAVMADSSQAHLQRITRMYQAEYELAVRTHQRITREAIDERERAESEARDRANAESARATERNRRDERQKRYRETVEEISREMEARREAGASMAAALAEAQGVRGANFVRSLSTSMGEFRFAQDGASEAVAKAQIRAAELLDKIEENTKAMTELQKEQKWINSLR